MIIRKAKITESKEIKKIIDQNAEKGLMLNRSLDDLYDKIRDFTVCLVEDQVVGACALTVFTDNYAEIRSLGVLDDFRNQNMGHLLVKACIEEAKEFNIANVFTLTYIPEYFKKLKFNPIDKQSLPHKIWRDCVTCKHFYNCDEEALIYHL